MSRERKRIPIGKWLNNNKFVAVLSVFLAVVIWLVVVLQFSDRIESTFADIPVTFDTTMTDKLELQMFGQTDLSVTVTVAGKRHEISTAVLSKEDFIATASSANVSSAGKYTLSITVRPKDDNKDIEIISFSPKSVDIYFDYNLTENYPVQVQISAPDDQIAADGCIEGEPLVSTAEVTVSGAAAEVQKIDRVLAKVTLTEPLSETAKFENTALAIVNENGGIVRSTYVQVADGLSDVTVTVPILKVTQFTPSVRFKNSPSYFLEHPIDYICSPSGAVNAAMPTELLENADSLSLGTIDFSRIKTGTNSFEFRAQDIPNIRVLDDIDVFRVFFSIDGFQSRKFTITADRIALSELPEDSTVSIPEDTTLEVTVIGHADELETLTEDSLTATLDAAALEADADATTLPVSVNVGNTSSCWVTGSYSVPITVS